VFRFEVAIDTAPAIRALDRVIADARQLRPVFEQVLEPAFYTKLAGQFDTEGRQDSGGWKPLNPDYARWKARRYPGKGILERTSAVRRSLTARGAPGSVRRISDREMVLGTSIEYAGFHQGGRNPRPPIEWGPRDDSAWGALVEGYYKARANAWSGAR
jgi:phage gpG-like protein